MDKVRWEYKTIAVPSMDEWLINKQSLALEAAGGRGHDKIIAHHCAYVDKTLGDLGREGWELVSLWESGPSRLFQYTANWITFKRPLP